MISMCRPQWLPFYYDEISRSCHEILSLHKCVGVSLVRSYKSCGDIINRIQIIAKVQAVKVNGLIFFQMEINPP